jgi:hypothetical protein
MSEITISRPVVTALFLAVVGAAGVALVAMMPEIERYLKIKGM